MHALTLPKLKNKHAVISPHIHSAVRTGLQWLLLYLSCDLAFSHPPITSSFYKGRHTQENISCTSSNLHTLTVCSLKYVFRKVKTFRIMLAFLTLKGERDWNTVCIVLWVKFWYLGLLWLLFFAYRKTSSQWVPVWLYFLNSAQLFFKVL